MRQQPASGGRSRATTAAKRRLLQYLQALGCPPAERERLAELALAKAAGTTAPPLAAALATLQKLLPAEVLPRPLPPRRQSMVPEPPKRGLQGQPLLTRWRRRCRLLRLLRPARG